MKRLGKNLLVSILLASFIFLPVAADARMEQTETLPPCTLSMVHNDAMADQYADQCNKNLCKACSTCDSCAHCLGGLALGQGLVYEPSGADLHVDTYTATFLSIYPPVDSPPPRLG